MKQTGKTVLTVLIVFVCIFIFFIGSVMFKLNTDDAGYKIAHHCEVEISDIRVEKIGDNYQGLRSKIGNYYLIRYQVKNPCNLYKNTDDIYFYYESKNEDNNFHINVAEDNTLFSYDNIQMIPACGEAEITRVIEVEEGCTDITVFYQDIVNSSKNEFHVSLK